MKNEIRFLNESERLKTEELENAEQEITKMKEEVKFFRESNKELVNSIDEVERTLQEIEGNQAIPMMIDGSVSNHSHSQNKFSKRSLVDENEKLTKEIAELQQRCQTLSSELSKIDSDKTITQRKLETAESNIEILNETLEFLGNENTQFKGNILRIIVRAINKAERNDILQKEGKE